LTSSTTEYTYYDLLPANDDLESEVLQGLQSEPKQISPKFFYDAKGSKLFDQITRLPEYYLTRTEMTIFKTYLEEMAELIGPDSMLVEFGSGSSEKIRIMLEAIRPAAYLALDISRQHLKEAAAILAHDYPWLEVHAGCIDYSKPWQLPMEFKGRKPVGFFPGSSIGNFEADEALQLLKQIREALGSGSGLLIGSDLFKDRKIIEAAYNDAQGITAAFNRNALHHLNDMFDAGFDVDQFEHCAFLNEEEYRIEMYLRVLKDTSATIAGHTITFKEGECVHTEHSHKYRVEDFYELNRQAGFEPVKSFYDTEHLFGVHYLEAKD
jgi:dimethylhistidine N-methyltransferase